MNRRAGLSALIIAGVLTFSGCSAPPIASDVAQELQSEVHEIAILTARGDTDEAVAAAHALSKSVRTAHSEGEITGDRAVLILQRVEQLIDRLARSGAAPAPADLPGTAEVPQPVAGPVTPSQSPKPEPTAAAEETDAPEPADDPEPTDEPEPTDTPDPAEVPTSAVPPGTTDTPLEPVAVIPPETAPDNSGSGSQGNSGPGSGPATPVLPAPAVGVGAGEDDDNDGGKGRGRGRSSDD